MSDVPDFTESAQQPVCRALKKRFMKVTGCQLAEKEFRWELMCRGYEQSNTCHKTDSPGPANA